MIPEKRGRAPKDLERDSQLNSRAILCPLLGKQPSGGQGMIVIGRLTLKRDFALASFQSNFCRDVTSVLQMEYIASPDDRCTLAAN